MYNIDARVPIIAEHDLISFFEDLIVHKAVDRVPRCSQFLVSFLIFAWIQQCSLIPYYTYMYILYMLYGIRDPRS